MTTDRCPDDGDAPVDVELERLRARVRELEAELEIANAAVDGGGLLSAVFETSVAAITVLDPDGRIVYANESAEEILGLTPSEIVGRSYDAPEWHATAIDGGDWPDDRQPFTRVMATGEPVFDVRHAIEWPNGERKLLSINGAPIKDAAERVTSLVFSVTDITERLRIKRDARESNQWLHLALESAQMGIWSWDIATNEVRWSDELYALFGVAKDAFDGSYAAYLDRLHPDDREDVVATIERTLTTGATSYVIEHRVRAVNGAERWIEGRARVMRDADGRPLGITGTAVDVTKRKRTELALRESEAAFRAVLETVPSSIVRVGRDRTIRFLNRGLLGRQPADVVGEDVVRFVVDESREALAEAIERAFASGELQELECDVREPSGSARSFFLRIRPVEEQGSVESVTVVGVDVTQLKSAEDALRESQEQLRHAQRLESVGRLAGGVAHDFNNLLTVVDGCANLLAESLDPDADALDLVRLIGDAAARGASLTRQLLAFARRQVVEPRIVDVNRQIRAGMGLLEHLLGEDVRLGLALVPKPWPVEIDPGQFEQVLVNFAINARDAMPDGGRLTIESANLTVDRASDPRDDDLADGDWVVVSVVDTGVGIAPDVVPFIFEPFFTTKASGDGTGLGLSTCFGIVRQAGGDVQVDSEIGVGTRMSVVLPRASTAAVDAPGGDERLVAAAGEACTILLVEDDAMVRRVTRETLTSAGYDLLEAADGAEALDVFDANADRIGLVMTDVVMPGMSGAELVRVLLGRRPELRVLFVSGYSTELAALEELRGPHVHLLEKPYGRDALLDKIGRIGGVPRPAARLREDT